jgi:hypothetical protein
MTDCLFHITASPADCPNENEAQTDIIRIGGTDDNDESGNSVTEIE